MKFYLYCVLWTYNLQLTSGFLADYKCDLDCNGGTCHFVPFSRQKYCKCDNQQTGSRCEITNLNQNKCASNPCHHWGRCENTNSDPYFKCTCNFGYLGTTCDQTHCDSSPCMNNGKCHRSRHGSYYSCECRDGYSGHNCEKEPATQAPPAPAVHSTSAQPTTTTTTLPIIRQSCSKISTVFDIAEKTIESNPEASVCPSGNQSSPEAFVLNNCGFTSPTAWKKGAHVMDMCANVPPYTPVSTFPGDKYSSASSLVGIFIGCLQDLSGFTFAIQMCDKIAMIDHIVVGNNTFSADPKDFYTIEL